MQRLLTWLWPPTVIQLTIDPDSQQSDAAGALAEAESAAYLRGVNDAQFGRRDHQREMALTLAFQRHSPQDSGSEIVAEAAVFDRFLCGGSIE